MRLKEIGTYKELTQSVEFFVSAWDKLTPEAKGFFVKHCGLPSDSIDNPTKEQLAECWWQCTLRDIEYSYKTAQKKSMLDYPLIIERPTRNEKIMTVFNAVCLFAHLILVAISVATN